MSKDIQGEQAESKQKILVVDDEASIRRILETRLKMAGYAVITAEDGEEAVELFNKTNPDLVILDVMMPVMDGYEVLSKLRRKNISVPILMLTAKDGLNDKLKGFELGADDYVSKPFERAELLARIEAIIRRSSKNYGDNTLKFQDLILNLKSREVSIGNEKLILQGKQFDLLEYLIKYQNTIITKEQIFDKIWGFDSDTTTNVVEVYASGLRKELKKYGYDKYLKTIRSVGYIWK